MRIFLLTSWCLSGNDWGQKGQKTSSLSLGEQVERIEAWVRFLVGRSWGLLEWEFLRGEEPLIVLALPVPDRVASRFICASCASTETLKSRLQRLFSTVVGDQNLSISLYLSISICITLSLSLLSLFISLSLVSHSLCVSFRTLTLILTPRSRSVLCALTLLPTCLPQE